MHHTKAERENIIQSYPENVRSREEAAARCTKKIWRRVLKKQARKAKAEHLVKGCLEPGKKKVRRKLLTELYVKGSFTEDREEWQKELQRHCEEVHTDLEETREVQENRIESFKKRGDQQFTLDGRNAEVTVDLVLQARAKMSGRSSSCPQKISTITWCFQERFMGLMEAPSSWKTETGLLEETPRSVHVFLGKWGHKFRVRITFILEHLCAPCFVIAS